MIWRVCLLVIAYLLLGAHFLRDGHVLVCAGTALLPALALLKHKNMIYLLQALLVAGVLLVWLPTLIDIARYRIMLNQPWLRMALILGGVMLFSLFSAWSAKALINNQEQHPARS